MSLTLCFLYLELAIVQAVDLAVGRGFSDAFVLAADFAESVVAADVVGCVVIEYGGSMGKTGLFGWSVASVALGRVGCFEEETGHSPKSVNPPRFPQAEEARRTRGHGACSVGMLGHLAECLG